MKIFSRLTIKTKLVAIILAITTSIVFIGFTAVIIFDVNSSKRDIVNSSVIHARLVGENAVGPLVFSDEEGGNELLSSLSAVPSIENAKIYTEDDRLFAQYDRSSELPGRSIVRSEFHEFDQYGLHIWQPIRFKKQYYGVVYLRVSLRELIQTTKDYIYALLGLMVLIVIIAYLLARNLQGIISRPITRLVCAVEKIRDEENYTFRVAKETSDEIGVLYDAFNGMMDTLWERRVERDKALRELFEEKEWAQVTLQSIGDGVITTDTHGNVQYLNTVAEQLTGWTLDEAQGLPLSKVFKILNGMTRVEIETPVARCLREQRIIELSSHTSLIRKDGNEIAIEDSAAPIRNQQGEIIGVVLVFHDVTEARKLSHQLNYLARHDTLTDLINRREFEVRLERLIEQARQQGTHHALLYMDLDQFKIVNDTCGHSAGDELLRQVSALLQSNMRQRDTLARLGGDEFAVILEHCLPEEARQISEMLCDVVRDYNFVWEDHRFSVGVSIGLVPINSESGSLTVLMSLADSACFSAKESGRNRVHSYEEDGEAVVQRHGEMRWVSRINHGLEHNRFVLFSQSIAEVGLGANAGRHCELLLRMRDESGGLVLPGAFLPAAERYNLMPKLDRWVVESGLAWLSSSPEVLADLDLCSINLSGHSVGDEKFLQFVMNEVENSGVPADKICFEITETATVVNLTAATRFIGQLRKIGCRFALDDFGSGMSSFLYLKNLPVDYLKIDGGFVRDIVDDPMDFALVKSINDIGHVMGMRTIAEFVETEEVLQKLREMGVDYVQGYHVGKPQALLGNGQLPYELKLGA